VAGEGNGFGTGSCRVDAPGRVANLATEHVESDPPPRLGYDWVDFRVVRKYDFKQRG